MRLSDLETGAWFIDVAFPHEPHILLGRCSRHPRGLQFVRGTDGKLMCADSKSDGIQPIEVTLNFEVDDAGLTG